MQGNGKDIPTTAAACIDAETLAAWADGGLPKAEAALVEVHLADCDRCTAMLATFARSEPPAQVPESLWTRWHLRWLVPVATAATVAALWVIVPSQRPVGETAMRTTVESATPAPATSAQSQVAPPASSSGAPAEPQAKSAPAPTTAADALARRAQESPAPQELSDARKDANAKLAPPTTANETFAAAPPPPTPESERREARKPDTTSFSPLADASAPAPAGAAPAPAAPPAATSPAAPPPTTLSAESARARGGAGALATLRSQPFSTALLQVVSPDPMTRWRVVGPGRVERSIDGGTRWERATLPEMATLTGGSSPSPSVLWLVGRTGAIYVTTDGLRFMRVPFPDRVDFVSIQALDARRATVITIDGRTMRTEDQGANWIRVSP